MKIYLQNDEIHIKGSDRVRVRSIWLIIIMISILIIPFIRIFGLDWIIILIVILLLFVAAEFSFQYIIEIKGSELCIRRQFLTKDYWGVKFAFNEVNMNKEEVWIQFKRGGESITLEKANGIEINTIHIISEKHQIELGSRNDGRLLMKDLPGKLLEIGIKIG